VLKETADEFEVIFLPDCKVGVGLVASEDVINDWSGPACGDIDRVLVMVLQHVCLSGSRPAPVRNKPRTRLFHGFNEEGIEAGRNEQIEVGDRGKLDEGLRWPIAAVIK
jgi:hypothetical protein